MTKNRPKTYTVQSEPLTSSLSILLLVFGMLQMALSVVLRGAGTESNYVCMKSTMKRTEIKGPNETRCRCRDETNETQQCKQPWAHRIYIYVCPESSLRTLSSSVDRGSEVDLDKPTLQTAAARVLTGLRACLGFDDGNEKTEPREYLRSARQTNH